MGNKTALYASHAKAGAKLVDFGGWDMPLHFGSQLDEHHIVRRSAGVFDVSHMTVVDINGADAEAWLRYLLANDIAKLERPGRGIYSCMLNENGGVVDDLIAYRRDGGEYRLVMNAGTRDKDLAWLAKTSHNFNVHFREQTAAAMLAVQGPSARRIAGDTLPKDLRSRAEKLEPFAFCESGGLFVARTGYTGEDGWELIFADPKEAVTFWLQLLDAGIAACGLGARDTLRLEAGLALYGQDLDEETSPLVSGLSWTVAFEPTQREFIGRGALEAERERGPGRQFVGLLLEDRGIMRSGQRVVTQSGDGVITSGGFGPTLDRSLALARVPLKIGEHCSVDIRNRLRQARVVKPRFVRHGSVLVALDEQDHVDRRTQ